MALSAPPPRRIATGCNRCDNALKIEEYNFIVLLNFNLQLYNSLNFESFLWGVSSQ